MVVFYLFLLLGRGLMVLVTSIPFFVFFKYVALTFFALELGWFELFYGGFACVASLYIGQQLARPVANMLKIGGV